MNARAIELYKQAIEFAYSNIGKEHADTSLFNGAVAGKFAELIMQDCLGICVKETEMHESNGNVTHTVFLARVNDDNVFNWHQVYADRIKGRAEYEAANLRHFLGQGPEPDLLNFDTDERVDDKSVS